MTTHLDAKETTRAWVRGKAQARRDNLICCPQCGAAELSFCHHQTEESQKANFFKSVNIT
jgi:hypothetical protein